MKPTCEYYTPISQLISSTFTLFSSQRTCDKNKDSTTVSLSLAGNTRPSLDYVWPRKYIDKCLWVGIVIKYGKTKNWLNTRHFFMSMMNVYDNTRSPGVPTQKRHQIWKNCLYYACTEFVALPSKSLNPVSVTQSVKSKRKIILESNYLISEASSTFPKMNEVATDWNPDTHIHKKKETSWSQNTV